MDTEESSMAFIKTRLPQKKTLTISGFSGVDFANDETEADAGRSPWAANMTADIAGRPVLRPGYVTLLDAEESINGIHFHKDAMLLHFGTAIAPVNVDNDGEYSIGTQYSGMSDVRSVSFYMNGKTYIMDGAHYICFDGSSFSEVTGYIPTTVINRLPAGGGTVLEAVNMLTGKRKNSFTADGVSTVYQLDGDGLSLTQVCVNVDGTELSENTDFTVDRGAGTVTFVTAPADDGGVDSITVTFELTANGKQRITACTTAELFGAGNAMRIFITGDPLYPNVDYMSGLYDPTYYPDTGYTKIGSDDTAILGYIKQYGSLVIVKEAQDGRGGLFLRQAASMDDGSIVFTVKEGVQGIGAINRTAFANVCGDPCILTGNGVYGLTSDAVTNQQSMQLRSWYINPRLINSESLGSAVLATWGRLLIAAVGTEMFVANTESKNRNRTGDFGYEWYHWTDVPSRVLKEHEGTLFIGTADGKLRRFKSVSEHGMNAYSDDGAGINAMWTTPLLDGGCFMKKKNICRRGTGILIKPFIRSSGEIFFTTDKSYRSVTGSYTSDVIDFDDIDFNRFTFNCRDNPKVEVSPKKFRGVLQFQMGVRHTAANEGFGILAMMITFTVRSYIKK